MSDYKRFGNYLRFKDWVAIDPMSEDLAEAMHAARYSRRDLTQEDMFRILAAAEAYVHFSTHPASDTSICKQLKELRRAVREPKP